MAKDFRFSDFHVTKTGNTIQDGFIRSCVDIDIIYGLLLSAFFGYDLLPSACQSLFAVHYQNTLYIGVIPYNANGCKVVLPKVT
jgi:hypothetical protein